MVNFRFYDINGTLIPNFDAGDDLPDEVSSMKVEGPFNSNTSNYSFFTSMLKRSPRKLERITVSGFLSPDEESPEFLGFLVLIFNKTSKLHFQDCLLSTNATSCLMASLFTHDGIRRLSITSLNVRSPMPTNQAKILLEGVASSPCLEYFGLLVSEFASNQDVCRHLTQALRRNKSLKRINVFTYPFPFYESQNIIKASMLGPNVKHVSIVESPNGRRQLPLEVLQDAVCHQDCTLEKLHLSGISISTDHGWDGSIVRNVSVKSLKVHVTGCNWDTLRKVVSLFRSLEELNLSNNQITQLSFLDPLLLGEISKLNSLDVSANRIGQTEMQNFIEKLRRIKGLKHLAVDNNNWTDTDSGSSYTALIDSLRHNTELEHIDVDRKDLPLDLNRGGRRVFESSQPFPANLLPLVLERASKISYYKRSDEWGSPTNKEARADVVFWIMHRIVPQL